MPRNRTLPKLSPPRLMAPDESTRGLPPATPFVSTWDDLPADPPRRHVRAPGFRLVVTLVVLGAALLTTVVPL
jgi:hypothetical protein